MVILHLKATTRFLWYVLTISIGGAVIGIDLGVIATTIGQQAFKAYMFPPGTKNVSSLEGAIVSLGSAGNAVGCLSNGFLLERLGRKKVLLISTFFTIVGAICQAASNGIAAMIVGRFISGVALGILNPTIPIYISELARPFERARLVGIFGLLVAVGFLFSNWIGYSASFAPDHIGWRLALAMQIPLAVILMVFSGILPESPRWLAQQERYEEFDTALHQIYDDEDEAFYIRTQIEIREQIRLEIRLRENRKLGHALIELFSKKYIKRTAMAIMVMQVGILSGSLAIQNYQSILYESLGYSGRGVLFISGLYGIMGVIGQCINLLGVSDRWSRRQTMWIGCATLAVMLTILMILSVFYGHGNDGAGARTGVAFVFLYSLLYAVFFNSTLYTIAAETFPMHLRGYGTSIAALCQGLTALWLGQVTPFAFEAIHWWYYLVFIGNLVVLSIFYFFTLTETNRINLELIGGKFGDDLIDLDDEIKKNTPKELEKLKKKKEAEEKKKSKMAKRRDAKRSGANPDPELGTTSFFRRNNYSNASHEGDAGIELHPLEHV
ncbi:putative transporter [Calycina marina]|uniref:Transporter n=1 Tax=Calycina marina TaxID=1763456 RepID=A0A9P8CFZ3_9HELO|nr:putative transporter [Calycina marina]